MTRPKLYQLKILIIVFILVSQWVWVVQWYSCKSYIWCIICSGVETWWIHIYFHKDLHKDLVCFQSNIWVMILGLFYKIRSLCYSKNGCEKCFLYVPYFILFISKYPPINLIFVFILYIIILTSGNYSHVMFSSTMLMSPKVSRFLYRIG